MVFNTESCCERQLWMEFYKMQLEAGETAYDAELAADNFIENVIRERYSEVLDRKITFFYIDGTNEVFPNNGKSVDVGANNIGTATFTDGSQVVKTNVEYMRIESA